MAAIELRNTTKRYPDGTAAVRDVSLRVEDSEIMILVGPSGCGKSTVLRMLAGLEDVTEGEIAIDGRVINELAPQERDIAMVFQNYALYPHMTVRRNMGFALKLQRVDSTAIDAKVEQAARILDLESQLDRRPGQLSGGQRQRVAMGRAIVRDPKAFLMDEPLSNLDAKLRVQMRSEIARLQARLGTTTIYVTHDQTEAMTLGHRVAVMRQGVVQQVGPPRELFERPANLFVAGFIGSPAMNFLPGRRDGDALDTPLGHIPLSAPQRRALDDGRPTDLICGIRPGDFEDAALVAESRPGARAQIQVDVLEHLGNEAYVHFRTGATAVAEQLTELAEDADRAVADERHEVVVARVGAETRAVAGGTLDLWFDPVRLHLFDAKTGRALRAETDERS